MLGTYKSEMYVQVSYIFFQFVWYWPCSQKDSNYTYVISYIVSTFVYIQEWLIVCSVHYILTNIKEIFREADLMPCIAFTV